MTANEAVEKVGKGLRYPNIGGVLTIPRLPIGPQRAFYGVDSFGSSSQTFQKGFLYNFNVEVTGAARLYRAASGGPQG